jgi:CheY-like chemotaxis protein
MTARLASGIDPTAGATEAEWRRRLVLRFEAEMAVKPNYHEFRIVGLDDGGREIVRVDRSKAAGKGTGLGLSMVYGFVKQSGGHIKIYSEVGHGTTIRVYLPRAGRQPQQAAVTGTASTLEGGGETVLLVEDDAMVRRSVTRQLQSIGYRTISTAGAAEALAVVDGGAAFDLLFTDVIMSGTMNGRQLANEVAKRRPGVNVLFTSGYTENAIVHHGRLDAGVLLLAKPYRKSELARMIRTAIDAPLSVAGGRLGAGGTRVG